ncbi:hypothetical protein O181_046838 [Austropuccinia psidii MF-1]|uniref:Uncharacterized protein n=1 Tax=Austropuccinia psidii MF-1 TaxID=1389203 RepID=A0A9Q3DT41_9BASI|nr:hypothetical protein [Austropuccinia psidii MF-1]
MRQSPIPHPRKSPMVSSQKLQPMASSRRRREDQLPLLFPATQVFQRREHWPVQVTRKDPNMVNKGQDAVKSLFRRVDRNTKKIFSYPNDRIIPCTASEEMDLGFYDIKMSRLIIYKEPMMT